MTITEQEKLAYRIATDKIIGRRPESRKIPEEERRLYEESCQEVTDKLSQKRSKDQRKFIVQVSEKVCGGLSPFVSEYLLAFLDDFREGNDKSEENLNEKRIELAKRFDQFRGSSIVEITKLLVNEMQTRIAAGGFDPKPDYK